MKFSQSTLIAILAATACANTFTMPELSNDMIVKRVDAYELLDIIAELSHVMNQKRDLSENDDDYHALQARADSALGNFIIALTNSGLIGDVFKIITSDSALKTQLASTVKSAVSGLLVQGPALVSALWNSGLMQEVFVTFLHDSDLRDSFIAVIKQMIASGVNKISFILSKKLGKLPQFIAKEAAPPVEKRDYTDLEIETIKRAANVEFVSEGEFLDKRDISATLISIIQALYNSGLVQALVEKALADPMATISFLTSALKNGVIAVKDLIQWAKECGLIDSMLQYIASSGNVFLQEILKFIAPLLEHEKPEKAGESEVSEKPEESSESPESDEFPWANAGVTTTLPSVADYEDSESSTTKKAKPTIDGLDILDAVAPFLDEFTKDYGKPTTMISSTTEPSSTLAKRMYY